MKFIFILIFSITIACADSKKAPVENKKTTTVAADNPLHPVVKDAQKPDCDDKAKEPVKINTELPTLGSGGCTLDEKK